MKPPGFPGELQSVENNWFVKEEGRWKDGVTLPLPRELSPEVVPLLKLE